MNTNLSDFNAGDSINFYFNHPDYSNSEYTCKIIFINNTDKFEYLTTTQDNNFILNLSDTSSIPDERYKVYAVFDKTGYKQTVFINYINVKENISGSSNEDILTYNKKMLDAIEDLLFKRTESDYSSYTIGNRSIVKMTPDSLLKWRNYFKDLVEKEEMVKDGKKNYIKVKWVGRYGN